MPAPYSEQRIVPRLDSGLRRNDSAACTTLLSMPTRPSVQTVILYLTYSSRDTQDGTREVRFQVPRGRPRMTAMGSEGAYLHSAGGHAVSGQSLRGFGWFSRIENRNPGSHCRHGGNAHRHY